MAKGYEYPGFQFSQESGTKLKTVIVGSSVQKNDIVIVESSVRFSQKNHIHDRRMVGKNLSNDRRIVGKNNQKHDRRIVGKNLSNDRQIVGKNNPKTDRRIVGKNLSN